MSTKEGQTYLDTIKMKIRAKDLASAEKDLHYLIVNKDFDRFWGNKTLPVLWGYIAHIRLDEKVPTAAVDLRNGEVLLNPQFILDKIHSLEDLLFIVLHERDHRILRRIFRVNWHTLNKILDYKEKWIFKVRNVLEDAWINASVRSEMGIGASLPENFYCWTKEDTKHPGAAGPENPEGSGFDPKQHKVGEPKSEEYALLTCLSSFCDQGIQNDHGSLYIDAHTLLKRHGIQHTGQRSSYRKGYDYSHYSEMLSFPAWFEAFCDWLRIHKNDLAQPSPDCEGDSDCPVHGDGSGEGEGESEGEGSGSGEGDGEGEGSGGGGSSGEESEPNKSEGDAGDDGDPAKGDHSHGGNQKCSCRGGEGLLGEPMTLAERLARVPSIIMSKDDLDELLDKKAGEDDGEDNRKGPKPSEPAEVFIGEKRSQHGAGWGGRVRQTEIAPHEVQNLDEMDRELLEMGGSALTEAWKTNTVQIKGAVKQYADELVQNIATMRVTEHKIMRPDFNIPARPTRRDLMNLGLGQPPPMWQHPQYIEQQELVVYTDVSGSMLQWYSVALYITNQLKEFGCDLYQFSTIICKPVPGRDDNIFWGDGGTDFDTVAEHIEMKGFKAVVIITDNEDSLDEKFHEAMKEVDELYCIFLQDGQRPPGLDIQKHPWGGSWGRNGWQKVTEKITGIFESDVIGGI